jgi:hypothetical protein
MISNTTSITRFYPKLQFCISSHSGHPKPPGVLTGLCRWLASMTRLKVANPYAKNAGFFLWVLDLLWNFRRFPVAFAKDILNCQRPMKNFTPCPGLQSPASHKAPACFPAGRHRAQAKAGLIAPSLCAVAGAAILSARDLPISFWVKIRTTSGDW